MANRVMLLWAGGFFMIACVHMVLACVVAAAKRLNDRLYLLSGVDAYAVALAGADWAAVGTAVIMFNILPELIKRV